MPKTYRDIFTTIQTFHDSDKKDRNAHILSREAPGVREEVARLQTLGHGIYWSVNPQIDANQRKINNTKEWVCVGMDIDMFTTKELSGVTEEQLKEAKDKFLKHILSIEFLPTGLIESHKGFYPYWIFDKPLPIVNHSEANTNYVNFIRKLGDKIGYHSEGDNICRVLRIPGYNHLKDPENPFMVREIEAYGESYNAVDLSNWIGFKWIKEEIKPELPKVDRKFDSIYDYPVDEALLAISGTKLVNGEKYELNPSGKNKFNIIIDGEITANFINLETNSIGRTGGDATPNIVDWCKWYSENGLTKLTKENILTVLDALLLGSSFELRSWDQLESSEKEEEKNVLPLSLSEILEEYNHFQELKKNAPSTGFLILDDIIGGVVPGSLITFTANTNVGKTTFASNISVSLSNQGKKILYLALEPRTRILSTLASAWSGETYDSINNNPSVVADFVKSNPNIEYYDRRHFKNIEEVIEQVKRLPRYDAIVIDHMGYFTNDNESVVLAESQAINALSCLAYDNETAVINIVHTNKTAYEKKEPLNLSNLKGSSSIAQDSTDVIVIDRDEDSMDGTVKVLKTKNKGLGAFKIRFSEDAALIKEEGFRMTIEEANKTVSTGDVVAAKIKTVELLLKYNKGLTASGIKQLLKHYGHSKEIADQAIALLYIGDEILFNGSKYLIKQ